MTAIDAPRATCPAVGRLPVTRSHGGFSAAKEDGCTCPGEGQESFRAYKRRQDARNRAARPSTGRVTAPPFYSPPVPEPVHSADDLERRLLNRRDLACQDGTDPELWFPVGHGPHAQAQAAAAKRICASCPALTLCAEVMLNRADTDGIAGGMDPDERRAARCRRGLT